MREYDIDGWRIDSPMNNYDPQNVSGDHSRVKLLRAMKTAVTRVKPSAYFMAEISGPRVLWGKDDRGEQPLFDEMCEGSHWLQILWLSGAFRQQRRICDI